MNTAKQKLLEQKFKTIAHLAGVGAGGAHLMHVSAIQSIADVAVTSTLSRLEELVKECQQLHAEMVKEGP